MVVVRRDRERPVHDSPQFLTLDRLDDVIVERHLGDVEIRLDRGEHHDPAVEAPFPDLLEHLLPAQPGHPPVQKHDIDALVDGLQCLLPAECDLGFVLRLESEVVGLRDTLLVVHDQDPRSARRGSHYCSSQGDPA